MVTAESSDESSENLLDHGRSPFHRGILIDASHVHLERSVTCGDEVRLQLQLQDGFVVKAWFDGRGCLVSQGAASILCERIDGGSLVELKQLRDEDILHWIGIPLSPIRRTCGLLAFRGLQKLISAIEREGAE